jgi:hypothetical protein
MAAQGFLPFKPKDLLQPWTHLLDDADEGVRSAADESRPIPGQSSLGPQGRRENVPPKDLGCMQ